jgi:hypothetical protein
MLMADWATLFESQVEADLSEIGHKMRQAERVDGPNKGLRPRESSCGEAVGLQGEVHPLLAACQAQVSFQVFPRPKSYTVNMIMIREKISVLSLDTRSRLFSLQSHFDKRDSLKREKPISGRFFMRSDSCNGQRDYPVSGSFTPLFFPLPLIEVRLYSKGHLSGVGKRLERALRARSL